jgi:DNA-directed RNA polymerase specialized sigma24 family protein
MIRLLGEDAAQCMLAVLPSEHRRLISEHVIAERPYGELADESGMSEVALRQRVSRGLSILRRHAGTRR